MSVAGCRSRQGKQQRKAPKPSPVTRATLLVYLNLYVWRICSYYEFACECKFIQDCINQNPPLNLLLKARIKSTQPNLQTPTHRVHFASTEE